MKHIISKKNRALLSELVRTDFKLRYQGSVLGYAWTLLKPLLIFTILYIVFDKFLRLGRDIQNYPIYLLTGVIMWSFFTEMTKQSLGSIVGRGGLIRKIKIPRWIIVISASISAFINLAFNTIVLSVFILISGASIDWHILLLPTSLIEIYIFSLGISFFLAAAYVKLRDLNNIWDVVMQAGFYVTPIIYPITMIPNEAIQKILLINPVANSIQDARHYILPHNEVVTTASIFNSGWFVLIPYAIIAVTCALGVWYFRKESKYFAENV